MLLSTKRHYHLFINEMIGLYLVPTRLRTTNQLSTNQLLHAVNPVNHSEMGYIILAFIDNDSVFFMNGEWYE